MTTHIRILLVISLLIIASTASFLLDGRNSNSEFKVDLSYQSHTTPDSLVRVEHYGQVEQGSFFLKQANMPGYLLSPLIDTNVDIVVTGLVARAVVTQEFSNPTDDWVNGIYAFPLPENAAIVHLTMHIGERKIVGQIHPKQKAKKLYQQAKATGKKASLLVQNRPNLFTNHVANIGPGEKITVTIEYQQTVAFNNDTFTLRFPTTITKRYLPTNQKTDEQQTLQENGWGLTQPSFTENRQDSDSETSQPMHKVAINITLNTGFPLADISSEHHPIMTNEISSGQYRVSLEQDMIANRDFLLRWQAIPHNTPTAAHFIQTANTEHYGMIMLMPSTSNTVAASLSREVIFVIDTSGSMAGTSIQQAKKALISAVAELKETDTFNIIEFSTTANKVYQHSVPASDINKSNASTFIEQLNANGGTEILSALQLALGQQAQNTERLRQVIFITDGAVGNEATLFSYIDKHIQGSRLFTVGIGAAPNSYFMTEAATMGKGTFTYVNSINSVQQQMQSLFSKLRSPVLMNLEANFNQTIEMYPRKLPDLYQGEPIMISYFSQEPVTEMQVTGQMRQQQWQQTLALQNSGKQTGLSTLWARRKIAQLSRDKYKGEDADTVNQNILQLAMKHHLVSPMTSLVAIDVTPTAQKMSDDRQVKNHRPHGQVGVLPQTATSATLQAVLALLILGFTLCFRLLNKRH
ncbi:marine proteobacterial sortase target protein [Thalassotalea sediminis]|uniref:marine proteobacterial sortase target protein n=1 Tax=Thalassotalea sediminis TaxID=1759089 RepID=UPI002572C847|nr:marine proteobacterial sortase target protein [Thalassotalea sediminis]